MGQEQALTGRVEFGGVYKARLDRKVAIKE
jgi:hypothetical protein